MSEQKLISVTEFIATEILGDYRSRDIFYKVVKRYDIPIVEVRGRSRYYDYDEVISKLQHFLSIQKTSKNTTSATEDDIAVLKKIKIKEEIQRLQQDSQIKDLQIEQLKNTLIDIKEVSDFLVLRTSIELAILRRILFTEIPIAVPGLDVADAREQCLSYYNDLVKSFKETEKLWQKKYNIQSEQLADDIDKLINEKNNTNKQATSTDNT